MASIRKLKPNDPKSPWIVEYTDASGKRRRKTPKSGLKKDADKIRQDIEREMGDGVHVAKSDSMTVSAVCEEFIRHAELRLRDGRIGQTRFRSIKNTCIGHIIPVIGTILFSELKSRDVETLYEVTIKKGLKPITGKENLTVLKGVQDFAIKHGYAQRDVISPARKELRSVTASRIRTFTAEEASHLLRTAAIPKPAKSRKTNRILYLTNCYVNIAAFCGLRFGEICALRLCDVDLVKRIVHVRHNITQYGVIKGPKTKSGVRDIPAPMHVITLIAGWIKDFRLENDDELIFTTGREWCDGRGSTYMVQGSFRRDCWMPLLKKAGLLEGENLHFHALRHFAASWMIENGLSVTDVARLMGHSKFDMTLQVYAHPVMAPAHQQSAMDRMAEALMGMRPEILTNATETRLIAISH